MPEKDASLEKMINLGLAFGLEICLLVIFGYAGVTLSQTLFWKITLGAGLPLALVIFWGIFLAPASKTRLKDPWWTIIKILVFTLGAGLFYFTGLKGWAAGFEFVTLLNLVLLYIYR